MIVWARSLSFAADLPVVRPQHEDSHLPADDRFSQRAHEVAEDLLSALDQESQDDGSAGLAVQFHLMARRSSSTEQRPD